MKMEVLLKLKEPYKWPSPYPEKPNQNQVGVIETDTPICIGATIKFEDLNARSEGGQLNRSHYKYFSGKIYKVCSPSSSRFHAELLEVCDYLKKPSRSERKHIRRKIARLEKRIERAKLATTTNQPYSKLRLRLLKSYLAFYESEKAGTPDLSLIEFCGAQQDAP